MQPAEARRRFAAARVARLATVRVSGQVRDSHPGLVPVCFAISGDTVYSAVDDVKPKRGVRLARLADIERNPHVALLADHYEEDWSALWWARADGTARILAPGDPEARTALALLAERYPQYAQAPPPGPVVAVDVQRWSGWSASG